MTLAERLAAIVRALPESGAVTLPVSELKQWLAENPNGPSATTADAQDSADRFLTAKELAAVIGASPRYVYAHRQDFPFAKLLPGGGVRFSQRGLHRWMDRRG